MSEREGDFIVEITEDVWDCRSCGTTGIQGRQLECPSCGHGFDATATYQEGDGTEVTDPELLKLARSGANWLCSYCDMENRATDPACARCGASRDESPEKRPSDQPPLPVYTTPPRSRSAMVTGTLLLAAVMCFMFWPRQHRGLVTMGRWHRTIHLEHL